MGVRRAQEAGDFVPAIPKNAQSLASNRAGGACEGYAHGLFPMGVIALNSNLDNVDIFKTQSD